MSRKGQKCCNDFFNFETHLFHKDPAFNDDKLQFDRAVAGKY